MKIIIGADIVPWRDNMEAFTQGNLRALVGSALEARLSQADFRIFNLEVPLTDRKAPIPKCGPNLIAPTAAAAGLKALGADLLTLANNHIMDQGVSGLNDTLDTLRERRIAFLGAGANLAQAREPYILEREGMCVGVYACAEWEFSIAGESAPGANPFDPLYSLDHIQALKRDCDYVIVLYHGGREEYRYPSPQLRQVCRRIVEKGADLVVCQHSHCIGCGESWAGGEIVYGQGNFLFTTYSSPAWNTGLLLELDLTEKGASLSRIPLLRSGSCVVLAQGQAAEAIEKGYLSRSRQIQESGFVEKAYWEEAGNSIFEYYNRSLGRPGYLVFRVLNLLCGGKLRRRAYRRKDIYALLNLLQCQAHREVYEAGLQWILEDSDR